LRPVDVRRQLWTCPMCSAGQRQSVLVGQPVQCPWCAGRAVLPVHRALALHAQLRAKVKRGSVLERLAA
jgi:hypothetical protein